MNSLGWDHEADSRCRYWDPNLLICSSGNTMPYKELRHRGPPVAGVPLPALFNEQTTYLCGLDRKIC